MNWSVISANDVVPQRWKNNGGWTRELLAWPHPAEWALRVSVADIEADGPFSAFPGVQRWIAVLQGHGMCLYDYEMFAGDDLFSFDGAMAPECSLVKGPTRDFNLMHQRGKGAMAVQAAGEACALQGKLMLLFTAEGGLLNHGGRTIPLAPLSLAWCEDPVAQALSFEGKGQAWWMAWSPNA